jgi:3-hydroxybutyryl-CoA dehydrogenase
MSFLCAKQPMKIAVLASQGLKEELKSKTLAAPIEFSWHSSLRGLLEEKDADVYFDMEFDGSPERTEALSRLLPRPVLINSVILTLAEIGFPFLRINGWPGFIKRPVVEVALADSAQQEGARKIFSSLEWEYRIVPDTAGMIGARIIAMIINEAYYTYFENISTKEEIDTAMILGTSYPQGPFEWGRLIGLSKIYELLSVLGKKDPRYTICEALENEVHPK